MSPELLEGAEPSVAGPLIAGDLDDGLMSKAKDTGKFLHRTLEPEQRVDKINMMVQLDQSKKKKEKETPSN